MGPLGSPARLTNNRADKSIPGADLRAARPSDSKLGDGKAWTPTITVKGGTSGFYTIGVGK